MPHSVAGSTLKHMCKAFDHGQFSTYSCKVGNSSGKITHTDGEGGGGRMGDAGQEKLGRGEGCIGLLKVRLKKCTPPA